MTDKPKSHGRIAVRPTLKPRELMTNTPEIAGAWKAKIITLFPEAFPGALGLSLTGQALKDGLWAYETIELRQYGLTKHKNVDDTPAGGGAGMVLRPDVVGAALEQARRGTPMDPKRWPVIYLSPRGKPFTQAMAQEFAKADGMTLLCGRFEGVDQRALDHYDVQEISIGDYVLTGGELAAQVLIDATIRLRGGVLGNSESVLDESHSNGLLEHPQYTKPSDWQGYQIPDILLSGHHGKIAEWRRAQSEELTKKRRPDLWRAQNADPDEDQEL
ncbi:MAG: tRNA (guanosine(37)-N1)-methyltransferase TrmD [Pseudomonadota bacterium]